MDLTSFGLNEHILNGIIKVLKENPKVNEVILFGSRAKGSFHAGSDIDLVLKGDNLELNDILNLSIEIDKLDLPYKIDILIFDRITENSLVEHIIRVGICLYNKNTPVISYI